MKVKHELTIYARCPEDGGPDCYHCTVYVEDRILKCEEVAGAVEVLTKEPLYQERLTQEMADRLQAKVKTVGSHRAACINTTVVCKPRRAKPCD